MRRISRNTGDWTGLTRRMQRIGRSAWHDVAISQSNRGRPPDAWYFPVCFALAYALNLRTNARGQIEFYYGKRLTSGVMSNIRMRNLTPFPLR